MKLGIGIASTLSLLLLVGCDHKKTITTKDVVDICLGGVVYHEGRDKSFKRGYGYLAPKYDVNKNIFNCSINIVSYNNICLGSVKYYHNKTISHERGYGYLAVALTRDNKLLRCD